MVKVVTALAVLLATVRSTTAHESEDLTQSKGLVALLPFEVKAPLRAAQWAPYRGPALGAPGGPRKGVEYGCFACGSPHHWKWESPTASPQLLAHQARLQSKKGKGRGSGTEQANTGKGGKGKGKERVEAPHKHGRGSRRAFRTRPATRALQFELPRFAKGQEGPPQGRQQEAGLEDARDHGRKAEVTQACGLKNLHVSWHSRAKLDHVDSPLSVSGDARAGAP